MAKRKLKKSMRAKTGKSARLTNRKSMIGKPGNPFYIDNVRTLI